MQENISSIEMAMDYTHKSLMKAYQAVAGGDFVGPRGKITKEVRNCGISIDPRYPITSFSSRNFNLKYAKKEVLWYLRGNRFDKSITEESGTWQTLIQPDGGINSNYGQVIFTGQRHFDWVVEELIRDPSSRRAVIILGDGTMLDKDNTDHRCTMFISYCIRQGKLHQTVHMRSNDVIFGLTNDLFFFGFLQQMVLAYLRPHYPDLVLGEYMHIADSLHVYQSFFPMLDNIIHKDDWYVISVPEISSREEVEFLRYKQKLNAKVEVPDDFAFAKWLLSQ